MSAIYSALAAVMADVDHVAKRDVNQHQRFHFQKMCIYCRQIV